MGNNYSWKKMNEDLIKYLHACFPIGNIWGECENQTQPERTYDNSNPATRPDCTQGTPCPNPHLTSQTITIEAPSEVALLHPIPQQQSTQVESIFSLSGKQLSITLGAAVGEAPLPLLLKKCRLNIKGWYKSAVWFKKSLVPVKSKE